MNICLIGNGLTNLVLAKVLASKNISVTILFDSKTTGRFYSRSIGLSKKNYDYFNKEIINIRNISWPISNIDVFKESKLSQKIFSFNNKSSDIFFIVKYNNIYDSLKKNLVNNKKIKIIKKRILYKKLIKSNYNLIINSDLQNKIFKEIFFKKFVKDYNSIAFTSIAKHSKIKNNTATQIFTKFGPLAFLPLSNYQTSVVFSILRDKKYFNEKMIKDLILKYNKKLKIKSFNKFEKFNLKSIILRKYHNKNILSFGDTIHKIHPLAGQGFNMTLRDINVLSNIIQNKLDLGLPLDISVPQEFELKTKHKNHIFSYGINFIYEFFKFDNKYENKYSNKILNLISKNNFFNKYVSKIANEGFNFTE